MYRGNRIGMFKNNIKRSYVSYVNGNLEVEMKNTDD